MELANEAKLGRYCCKETEKNEKMAEKWPKMVEKWPKRRPKQVRDEAPLFI
jgi:hypothetical protein